MSSGVGVFRQMIGGVTPGATLPPEGATAAAAAEKLDPALAIFTRQLFFSSPRRTRILFAAVDGEEISDFCEQIGKAIATSSHANVAVVHGAAFTMQPVEPPNALSKASQECESATHIGERLCRVPFNVFEAECKHPTADRPALSAFDYVVFGAHVGDCAIPFFCQACDGAVLVIRANDTRREAALRAKETVLSFDAELLGAVLVNRTFPVPEAIYRRL